MPVITGFELKLLEQPLQKFADQPPYIPPREGSMKLSELTWKQVTSLDNILESYANIGIFRKKVARTEGSDVALFSEYNTRRIPLIGAKHTTRLEAMSLGLDLKAASLEAMSRGMDSYIAGLSFNLPGGKACKLVGDIIKEVLPPWTLWTPEAAANYNALPQQCKTLIVPNLPHYKPVILQ